MVQKKGTYFVLLIILICVFSLNSPFFTSAFAQTEYVYLGGTPIGVIAYLDGALVIDLVEINTNGGTEAPAAAAGIKKGDIIKLIENTQIKNAADIARIVEKNGSNILSITAIREDNEISLSAKPAYDIVAGKYKLGVLVKNEVSGVGTLTYIRPDNLRFGGLGHKITDPNCTSKNVYNEGSIYNCNIVGVVKGKPGETGELRGVFNRNSECEGRLDKNLISGIFGKSFGNQLSGYPKIALGDSKSIKMGNAQIYTTINGSSPEYYDIEIIKSVKQTLPNEKSLVLHVKDERLIAATGGIVQGMSGSPIIQNGKLIGAVTHVFVNDPTRGFGIFIDWMIDN
ncbi:MAG: SpoIVB peptidase [Christensenellales bacterium]|jgi:stage IV sporulation protein B